MKCDELNEYYYYEDRVVTPATHMYRVYHADEVDAAIAELKARIQLDDDEMAGFLQLEEECGGGDLRNYIAELKKKLMPCLNGDCILTCEVVEKYGKENAELKQKLEDVKASHYAEMVDAGMRERRLRRELWLARAERASDKAQMFYFAMTENFNLNINGYSAKEKGHTRMRPAKLWRITWLKVERKCQAKAEEYK